MNKKKTNLLYTHFFVISLLFSTNAFSSPMGLFNSLSRWNRGRVLKKRVRTAKDDFQISQSLYDDFLKLPESDQEMFLEIFNVPYYRPFSFRRMVDESLRDLHPRTLEYLQYEIGPKVHGHLITERAAADRFIYISMNNDRYGNFLDELWENKDYGRDVLTELMEFSAVIGRREQTLNFVTKEHLIGNPKLLLEWWRYGWNYERKEKIAAFIRPSLSEMDESVGSSLSDSEIFQKFLNEDPFGQTVLQASRENDRLMTDLQDLGEIL